MSLVLVSILLTFSENKREDSIFCIVCILPDLCRILHSLINLPCDGVEGTFSFPDKSKALDSDIEVESIPPDSSIDISAAAAAAAAGGMR